MRRLFFLSITILLIEIFTYIGAKGLFWLIKPYLPTAKTAVMIGTFILSHLFLATLFVGLFRLGVGYLAVLWLGMLAIIITFGIVGLARWAGVDTTTNGMVRLFGVGVFVGLVGLSVYNAYIPTVRHLSLQIDKPINPLRIAMVSDTHLGNLVGVRQLNRLTDIIRHEKADLLIMPGDIMDDDTYAYYDKGMDVAFDKLVKSVNGNAIASLGNHDLYKTDERSAIVLAIRESGAILLDDKTHTLTINNTPITIIGRYDDHNHERKTTHELMAGVDTSHMVILLDHRPSQIDENIKLPIDLQVSGHTHNGQVFPANFIVKALNRVAYGYEQINGTHVVVSSGYGFWGIPFRLGSQAEVWMIDVQGK
ncbi:metallophosphoesterase [Moraxella oblonga]|uniref:metallophosphoesterase n=1 Tax=Moraxella oblonga TaxID=200413 RepID=UPI0008350D3C|nr:metallophosphoesterase [Moraxella oblonga]